MIQTKYRMLLRSKNELAEVLADCQRQPIARNILMVSPEHFDVQYVINEHMKGNEGSVDKSLAIEQWEGLKTAFIDSGLTVEVLAGVEGLPDMVFCANQTLPILAFDGKPQVMLSRMRTPERAPEVSHFRTWFEARGYPVLDPPADTGSIEGMGDCIWHPGKRLLWAGYGFRTDDQILESLSEKFDLPVASLRLHDPNYYHLDTCFSVLDEDSVLLIRSAFEPDGIAMIESAFENVIDADEQEGVTLFSANCFAAPNGVVFIQDGCTKTARRIREAGFDVVMLDLSEYLKAGGNAFCMKLQYW